MAKKSKTDRELWPDDLFDNNGPVFPVRSPKEPQPAIDFSVRLAQAIGRALKECPLTREQVAADMSALLGEAVSRGMLDAYASPAKDQHRISLWPATQ